MKYLLTISGLVGLAAAVAQDQLDVLLTGIFVFAIPMAIIGLISKALKGDFFKTTAFIGVIYMGIGALAFYGNQKSDEMIKCTDQYIYNKYGVKNRWEVGSKRYDELLKDALTNGDCF